MSVVLRTGATATAAPLVLRPWREEDVTALVEVYRGDELLRRYTRVPVNSVEDGLRRLDVRRRGWETGTYLGFAAFEELCGAAEGRLVANVALKRPEAGAPAAEVGYWTAPAARGRGVAPMAIEALTNWAFRTYGPEGLSRLELLHQVDNTASCRVAAKCRFLYESTLPARPPFPKDGHLHVRLAPGAVPGALSVVGGSM
ncbi:GNAT family N-acetyltransferase [Streptomyces sp. PKU-EA00015]|uniref:GNAT family N-acetyltransferase n=1 Tax=Streptomyces sp. PKU-EA00015 TaxID=2748326 RepID=UPI0015A0F27C|nr:GNAT family N-acetyltransferase [Streptomyces sp. PKU-EA00015]NWF25449.1 GNAT family N-acetyltransferase [Streptomyces sp. PKU-EA00015]